MRGQIALFAVLIAFSFAVFSTGCQATPKIPVEGAVGPYFVKTIVDSEAAQHLIERQAGRQKEDSPHEEAVKQTAAKLQDRVPSQSDLSELTEEHSVDFAAVVFGQQLTAQPQNQKVQRRFIKNLQHGTELITDEHKRRYVVVVVPGYDYIDTGPQTGANFALPLKLLGEMGMPAIFVEVDPIGTVEENAAELVNVLREKVDPRKRVLLVGASSAGPAIHLALGKLLETNETNRVDAWMNMGGLLGGSHAMDWLSSGFIGPFFRLVVWTTSWRMESFESMRAGESQERLKTLQMPEHIVVLNYVGLSLSGDIADYEFSQYRFLRRYGPNDGFSLLPDMILPGSCSLLAASSDHFFGEDPLIDKKAVAILTTAIQLVEVKPRDPTCAVQDGEADRKDASNGNITRSEDTWSIDWTPERELYRRFLQENFEDQP